METTHDPQHLQQTIKVTPTGFIWIDVLPDGAFKYGDGGKCWGYVGTGKVVK
jgi:hypothetical protein